MTFDRFPDELRPAWMPEVKWRNLRPRFKEGSQGDVEIYDQRTGEVYSFLTGAELDKEHDLTSLMINRMWGHYFVVHHPERICC